MTWLSQTAPGDTAFDRAFGLCPDLYRRYIDFQALFWQRHLVDPVILELCRLYVAELLGCASERRIRYQEAIDAGFDERKARALDGWQRAEGFDERERACLRFTELFVLDPHAISDDDAIAVRRALGTRATVALTEALALFDGFMRFRLLLGDAAEAEVGEPVIVPAPRVGARSVA